MFVCGRDKDHLQDALERIREVGEGDGVNVDLATSVGVDRFFEEAQRYLGGLDIAVINAAIPAHALADTDEVVIVFDEDPSQPSDDPLVLAMRGEVA